MGSRCVQLLMKMMLQIQNVYVVSGETGKNIEKQIHSELLNR